MIDQIRTNIEAHLQTVQQFTADHIEKIARIAETIVSSIDSAGKVLIAGNGGSAADAQHIAGEFVGRFMYDRRPLPAIALSTDTSILTCIANDYSFDDVFVRQVEALVRSGDVFWGLSTSGNSVNIIAAAEVAKQNGATVVAFTGQTGGKLAKIADTHLAVPADRTDRIQELHMLAYHIICQLVEARLCPR